MTFDDHGGGTVLTVSVNNTSSNLLSSISGQNSPLITGWGFSTTPDLPAIQSWSVIAGNGVEITAQYQLTEDGSVTGYGGKSAPLFLEEMVQTTNGPVGGIYNAASPGNTANAFPDIAVFTLTFTAPFALGQLDKTVLRMERVGYNGTGTLKLLGYAAETRAVPEANALLLLLTGFLGISGRRLRSLGAAMRARLTTGAGFLLLIAAAVGALLEIKSGLTACHIMQLSVLGMGCVALHLMTRVHSAE